MDLIQLGNFILNSGTKSNIKIDCDALSDNTIEALAVAIYQMTGKFHSVEGIPRGGLRLAEALKKYLNLNSALHSIVDDVLTTGGSMQRALTAYGKTENYLVTTGVVIFARGLCPNWIRAVFQMPESLWVK